MTDQFREKANRAEAAVRKEAKELAAAIADSDDEELLRLAAHHAAMAAHWTSVVGLHMVPTSMLTARIAGNLSASRGWQAAQATLLALILWRVW